MSGRGVGTVGVCGSRQHQDQCQRLEAQGHELWPHAEDRSRLGYDRAGMAAEGGDPRRARGYGVGPGASRG